MKLTILDTGLSRKDPYVIVDENEKVLAASYEENGEHSKAGLLKLTEELATLRAQLAEANGIIQRLCLSIAYNKTSSKALIEAQTAANEYLDKVKSA